MLNPIFWKKVQGQKHPGRRGNLEHQIPSVKVLFRTNAKSHKHLRKVYKTTWGHCKWATAAWITGGEGSQCLYLVCDEDQTEGGVSDACVLAIPFISLKLNDLPRYILNWIFNAVFCFQGRFAEYCRKAYEKGGGNDDRTSVIQRPQLSWNKYVVSCNLLFCMWKENCHHIVVQFKQF